MTLSPPEQQAIWLSLQTGLWSVLLGLPWALLFGWLLARREFFGKSLVETLLSLPLVLPPIVTGYALLYLFRPKGWLGSLLTSWGISIPFSRTALFLAAALVSFPLLLHAIQLAFSQIDPRLETAAQLLGASKIRAFWEVTFPLAWRGIVGGSILAFTRSLGEFGATVIFAGNTPGLTQTIPLAIYTFDQSGTSQHEAMAQRLVWVAIGLALFANALGQYVLKSPKAPKKPSHPTTEYDDLDLPTELSKPLLQTMVPVEEPSLRAHFTKKLPHFSLDISLELSQGIYALCGPSGSGKTTILHCIAGLQSPNQGQISLGAHHLFDQATHRDIAPQKRHITLVSQEKLLFPHLRVRQNIMYGWRHLSEAQKHLQPEEIARILHIEHLLDRFPSTLSGGEQQRVAIARAIAAHPKLLLLDEPTSHLDPANAQRLLLLLQHLQQRLALPILLTSHDQAFIQAIATKTYRLSQGKLEEVDESAKAPKDGSLGGRSKEEGNSTEEEKP
ncbi:MAG: molybdate ABC transporter permease subunit [Myxococcales bacterium]|nr:molybdate ABC transporter permease subunit [Myxococcales bacterium]MCB9643044.1 molybdate ABC transporter permease subunit [Myxococcales bacterium]